MTETTDTRPTVSVDLTVDGHRTRVTVAPDDTLLDTLRAAGHTSVRGTCGIGVCGTCTVLVDGRVTSSCLLLTAQARGRSITTTAGLRDPAGNLSAVHRAFLRARAYQCSFCTPGMTLAVHAALTDPDVGRDEHSVREYLAGNLCRCGCYPDILAAVAELLAGSVDTGEGGGP